MDLYKEIKFSSKKGCTDWIFNDYFKNTQSSNITVNYCNSIIYINYYFSTTYNGHFPLRHGGKYMYFCKTWRKKNISYLLKYFLRLINYSVVCFQWYDSLKQIIILLNGKIMHVIQWVTKTVNRDGKNLRHLKSQKINLFQSFLYFWAFNLVFICPTLCHLKTMCLLLMKQKLYALDAFFIEKLKLSENDPNMSSFISQLFDEHLLTISACLESPTVNLDAWLWW